MTERTVERKDETKKKKVKKCDYEYMSKEHRELRHINWTVPKNRKEEGLSNE